MISFSLDPASPEVPVLYGAADILVSPPLRIAVPAGAIPFPAADLTSYSFGADAKADPSPFRNVTLYFSVTRATVGIPGSVVNLQATGDGAAGDIFGLFVAPVGPVALIIPAGFPSPPGLGLTVLPPVESNVDAIDYRIPGLDPLGNMFPPIYYAVANTIIYQGYGGVPPVVYATAANLGLAAGDVIDALAVWNQGLRQLDADDRILISLTPASPSAAALMGPASIIQAFPNGPFVRIDPATLGLLLTDDVDAITLYDPGEAVGVPTGRDRGFGISTVVPNPVRGGEVLVAFTLRALSPARLELFDVAGRSVAVREVGDLGPGPHELKMRVYGQVSGVYLLRLTQGRETQTERVAVFR